MQRFLVYPLMVLALLGGIESGRPTVQAEEREMAPLIDSQMTLAEALSGSHAPPAIRRTLCLLDVTYYAFDGKRHRGQILIHRALQEDVVAIFRLMEEARFPVGKVVPIVQYNWSDEASMADNNTSAFNYRLIAGTRRLSHHGRGRALDINPAQNPVVHKGGRVSPPGAVYDPAREGTFGADHPVVRAFREKGWRWGGNFRTLKDYHHFDRYRP